MKIAIVGAGAMGSVYAGLLGDSGHEVWAIDPWVEHIDAIRRDGLRVEGASGSRQVRIQASTDAKDAGVCELIVIATKARHVGDAARAIGPLIGPQTLLLTIQNGLGAAERIGRHCDPERILVGVAGGFGASMVAPGHVHHNAMQLIRLGELQGPVTPRLERVAAVWKAAGFSVQSYDDIEQLVWEKFICNVTFSGPCTVLRWTFGQVLDDPQAWSIARACGLEAYAVGLARGVKFSFQDAAEYIEAFGRQMPEARPSMLLDHLAGRRSEIDAINGMVPELGRKAGVPTPVNDTIVGLVRALEADFA